MKRLTEYESIGGYAHAILTGDLDKAIMRLAAYEDTGLDPEKVTALQKDWSALCTGIGECGGIDRVKELAEADKDGRLVVLPCKVNDAVWITGSVRRLYSEKVRTFFCGNPSYSRGMADNGVKMIRTTGMRYSNP